MVMHEPRYSNDEFARRGNDHYEKKIRVQVEDGNEGKVVAIDIDSGQFEVAQDALTASDRLLAKCPNAQTWFVRIGHPALHRFGPRNSVEVDVAETSPLVGMGLLAGHDLCIEAVAGGKVSIGARKAKT
jgi:hypothetical protein